MPLFLVRRPGIAGDANELDAALTRLHAFALSRPGQSPQWLHSYAVHEADGRLGLACVFRADDALALRRHAETIGLAAAEIVPVLGRVVFRDEAADGARAPQ